MSDRILTVDGASCPPSTGPIISQLLHKKYAKQRNTDGLYEISGPVSNYYGTIITGAVVRWGGAREGVGLRGKDIMKYVIVATWAAKTEEAFMNVIEQLEGNYDAASKLWDGYKTRLTEFRSAVKNDVSSLEAASRKSTEATHKMKAAYSDVIALLNSEEMKIAVENAERLAAAMQALANLQSHKLVFAVTDQSKP